MRPTTCWLIGLCLSQALVTVGQNTRDYITQGSLPGAFERHARALGSRVTTPGSERVVMSGTLTKGGQKTSINLTYELPGKVRVQYGSDNRTAAFDGTGPKSLNAVSDDDDALMEALGFDIPETFLFNVAAAQQPRILGFGFVVQGESGFGSTVDIYELTQTVQSGNKTARITKQFQFDSTTSLLRRVSYIRIRAGVVTRVHTEFSQYTAANGNSLPARMTRRENGQILYDIQWLSMQVGAKQNDNAFDGH